MENEPEMRLKRESWVRGRRKRAAGKWVMPETGEKRCWRWVHETHTPKIGCACGCVWRQIAAANKARWSPKEGKSSHSDQGRKGTLGYKKKGHTMAVDTVHPKKKWRSKIGTLNY